MPRVGLDTEAVVRAAEQLADADGLGALTLAGLARRLGVRPPSLYAHIDGLEDLRRRLGVRGVRRLTAALQSAAAGRARREALLAVAEAYRAFAHAHPGLYAALQRAPDPDDAEAVTAAAEAVNVFGAILRGYGLEEDDAIHAIRLVRAALHGFVSLEAAEGFGLPVDLNETFVRLPILVEQGLIATARTDRR
jgi:AcrR family transcriptional regulator